MQRLQPQPRKRASTPQILVFPLNTPNLLQRSTGQAFHPRISLLRCFKAKTEIPRNVLKRSHGFLEKENILIIRKGKPTKPPHTAHRARLLGVRIPRYHLRKEIVQQCQVPWLQRRVEGRKSGEHFACWREDSEETGKRRIINLCFFYAINQTQFKSYKCDVHST